MGNLEDDIKEAQKNIKHKKNKKNTCVCVCVCVYIYIDIYIYIYIYECFISFPGGSAVKNLPAMQGTQVQSLGGEDPLEKEMATHSRILAWGIPWTEEPGRLQSLGS